MQSAESFPAARKLVFYGLLTDSRLVENREQRHVGV